MSVYPTFIFIDRQVWHPLMISCVVSANLSLYVCVCVTFRSNFQIGMNYTLYRCLEVSNFDSIDEEPSWTQSSSPWATPRDCWWPLDAEDERLCTGDSGSGKHKCEHDPRYMNESEFRWCGSNYDAMGNPRFTGGVIEGVEWDAKTLIGNATFVESLNWGYTTFDNIFVAFLSIFQSITMEGWSDILYQVWVMGGKGLGSFSNTPPGGVEMVFFGL